MVTSVVDYKVEYRVGNCGCFNQKLICPMGFRPNLSRFAKTSLTPRRNSAPQRKDPFQFASTFFTDCISARFIHCNLITCRFYSFFFQFKLSIINSGRIDNISSDVPLGESTFRQNNRIPASQTSGTRYACEKEREGLPFFLTPSLSSFSVFALYPTWQPVHRLPVSHHCL